MRLLVFTHENRLGWYHLFIDELLHARAQRTYCYFYERLYLAQALWQNSERRVFEEWSAKERTRVLTQQHSDGSWHDARFGDTYATAMNCLFLALPEGLLPIFQR